MGKKLSFNRKHQHPYMLILEFALKKMYSKNYNKKYRKSHPHAKKLNLKVRINNRKNSCVWKECQRCKKVIFPRPLQKRYCNECKKIIVEKSIKNKHKPTITKLKTKAFNHTYNSLNCKFTDSQRNDCLAEFLNINCMGYTYEGMSAVVIYKHSKQDCKTKIPYNKLMKYLESVQPQKNYNKFNMRRRFVNLLQDNREICQPINLVVKYIRKFFNNINGQIPNNREECEEFFNTHKSNLIGKSPITIATCIIYYLLPLPTSTTHHKSQRILTQNNFVLLCEKMGLKTNPTSLRNYMQLFEKWDL